MFRHEEVVPGVHQILMARRILRKDLYAAACYLVPADGLLIDAGIPAMAALTLRVAKDCGVRIAAVTHAHEDHIGAAAAVEQVLGVPPHAHPEALPILADPGRIPMMPYQRIFFGVPSPSRGRPLEDVLVSGRHRFRVIHSPGHSRDHVALFEEDRGWLFSGDSYTHGRDRVFRAGCDLQATVASLRVLVKLDSAVMFTGMGGFIRNPSRRIAEKLAYLEESIGRVRSLRREGLDDSEIARHLFPGDLGVRLVTSGDFSAINLVRACLKTERTATPEPSVSPRTPGR